MYDFLYLIIAIVVATVIISIVIHSDPDLKNNWVFWVGAILVIGVFIGVPTAILRLAKGL